MLVEQHKMQSKMIIEDWYECIFYFELTVQCSFVVYRLFVNSGY